MKHTRSIIVILILCLLLAGCSSGTVTDTSTVSPETEAGNDLRIYCFEAGKADAFLLTTADSAVLIDTGDTGFGDDILDQLDSMGITELDCMILTHFDKDHIGGAAKILKKISVAQVLQTVGEKDSSSMEKYLEALEKCGLTPQTVTDFKVLEFDGVSYTVYPPLYEGYTESDSNNTSLMISVEYGQNRFLFCGDAENARIQEFVKRNTTDYDFIKIPHHGQWQSSLETLLQNTTPEFAVITSSDEEPEDDTVMTLLETLNIRAYRTRVAPVLAVSDGNNISVKYDD